MKNYSLGIDTSNYTTSVALTDDTGRVLYDRRKMLNVKEGERGLRQQEALFQHINNLPVLINDVVCDETRDRIGIVAVSSRPRPVSGSYMPCFTAGQTVGSAVCAALGVPYAEFSHQEGHIAAVDMSDDDEFLSYHLSGGTCELLRVRKNEKYSYDIEIIGGSRDISAGQLLDRTGVAIGYGFPAGRALDEIALRMKNKYEDTLKGSSASNNKTDLLTGVKIQDLWFSLSGLETQVMRYIERKTDEPGGIEEIVYELFRRLTTLLVKETIAAREKTGVKKVVFAGGVSKSSFIRNELRRKLDDISFGEYSEDNAVGISLLGGRYLWR